MSEFYARPVLPSIVSTGARILLIVYAIGNTTTGIYSIGILLLLYPVYLIFRRIAGGGQ